MNDQIKSGKEKLVRNNIPQIMTIRGKIPQYRYADDKEFQSFLLNKLKEEVNEFIQHPSESELADINEVIATIIEYFKYSDSNIKEVQLKKRIERGGFSQRIILKLNN